MHYTKIEMAESMSTRMKISARRFLQLCGCSHESRYILRISSKAGLSKDLYSKVSKTCGIKISVLCRSGITFVDKMDQFIWRAQSVDNMPSDLNSEYSVKQCIQLSPSSHLPSKSLSKGMPPKTFDVDEPQ